MNSTDFYDNYADEFESIEFWLRASSHILAAKENLGQSDSIFAPRLVDDLLDKIPDESERKSAKAILEAYGDISGFRRDAKQAARFLLLESATCKKAESTIRNSRQLNKAVCDFIEKRESIPFLVETLHGLRTSCGKLAPFFRLADLKVSHERFTQLRQMPVTAQAS